MSIISNSDIYKEVSIVICTKDRHELLVKTVDHLQSLLPQEEYLEIVIIEETNKPRPLEGNKLKYYTIPESGRGLGFTRNMGLKNARGALVVFIDDDIRPSEGWFKSLLTPFEDDCIGAVGGAVLPDLSQINTIGKCASFLGFPAGGIRRYLMTSGENYETDLISTGNCAFRADLGRSVGGFDELLRNGEDTEFFSRISESSKTLFIPKAIVFHKQRNSFKGVFRWFMKRGRGRFLRACKKGSHPFLALIFPIRGNFLLKLLSFTLVGFLIFFFSPLVFFIFLSLSYLAYNTILWKRERILHKKSLQGFDANIFEIKESIVTKDVMIMLPLVKLTMDMGREIGKFMAFFRYMHYRVLAKPLVLTFHQIGHPKREGVSSDSKYYFPAESLQEIIDYAEKDGWVIVSLMEVIRRLRERPNTLYFEKILAITFDDAYTSIFEPVIRLSEESNYSITIFLPTSLAEDTSQYEGPQDSVPKGIMNWVQIRKLNKGGAEIGSHTKTHPHLLKISKPALLSEVDESLSDLKTNIPGYQNKEIVFSYPFGEYDEEVLEVVKNAGYVGAVANYMGNIRPTTDPYQIPRFTVFADSDWQSICRQSRSMWTKELVKDVRDRFFRRSPFS